MKTTTLFRPVGPKELALIEQSGWKAFPPRLPDQPIFYPVNAPCGVPLTRAWPLEKGAKNETTDHPHQKSAWFCHGDVVAEGTTLTNPRKGIAGSDLARSVGSGTLTTAA